MREEYKPLLGFWSRNDLSRLWETVCDLLGQVSGLSEFRDILPLNGEAIHLPCAPDPDMIGVLFGRNRWVLGRWSSRMNEQMKKRAWVKEGNPYPFIKVVKIMHVPTRPKTRLFPKHRANGTVRLPMPVWMRIPQ